MLEISNLHVSFGMIKAVKGISFHINKGEIVTLIGSNGAGKTTTLRTISSLQKAQEGKIEFLGIDLRNTSPHDVVRHGLTHVPEGRRVFANLTVKENLEMGAVTRQDIQEIEKDLTRVFNIFPRLLERKNQHAGTLSGGEQQMLAIARAIMTRGKLLLLDEPSMGLAPMVVEDIFQTIKLLNDEGTTILLVEQNAFQALKIAHRAYVLETGTIVAEGDSRSLMNNDQVRQAYLGI